MKLQEMSGEYLASARLLRERLHLLRKMLTQTEDPDEISNLHCRINTLTPMLTQMYELAELTEHYYERGFYRDEKYTI